MAEKLTPQQKMAVVNRGGRLLVSAAAGSGKTKVLVDRLCSYIMDPADPANVDDFLIITYTKAAAAELRGKIADKLTQLLAQQPENRHLQQQMQRLYLAKISTVHAFCSDILREFAYKLDLSADFRIAEESECTQIKLRIMEQVLDEAYANIAADSNFMAFVDTQGLGRDDRLVPEIVLQIYSSALCHLDPEAWLDSCVENIKSLHEGSLEASVWGQYLIKDLKHFLDLQIKSLSSCVTAAEEIPGMEKPAALFKDTIYQLKQLVSCRTWDEIVNFPAVSYGTLSFKKEHRGTGLAEEMKAVRGYCKTELAKKMKVFTDCSEKIIFQSLQLTAAEEGLVSLVKRFKSGFEKAKAARRILDFSDIEQKTLDLLLGKSRKGITAAADEIGKRFREIMVDEYQDSNEVQDAIFTALTDKRNNCFMVGDVKQSIYQFRLADPGIFLDKYNHFLPAETATGTEGRKILLNSNFRSSAGVISAVNDVFRNCMSEEVGGLVYDENEILREGIPHVALPDPETELYGIQVMEDTYAEEASFVAERIQVMLDKGELIRSGDNLRPVEAGDIVILLRSPGSVGGEFMYALQQRGIRCAMGSGNDLLQEPEIETVWALLQIISNPTLDIPLLSVLTSPLFGYTADELAALRSNTRHMSVYASLDHDKTEKTTEFLCLLEELRQDARFYSVAQLLDRVFVRTKIRSIYGAMADGQRKLENLQNFYQIAVSFEAQGRRELSYFLEYLEAMQVSGLEQTGGSGSENCVRIMSIHKSKGLEFPVVFLSGLSRRFNTSDLTKQVLCHKDFGLGLSVVNSTQRVRFPSVAKRAIAAKIHSESISEELRVLYVAMTRARDRLIMTYAEAGLEKTLMDLSMRMTHSASEVLTSGADCPGQWVLFSALKRSEAGEFFSLAGYSGEREVSDIPWKIRVVYAPTAVTAVAEETTESMDVTQEEVEKIKLGLIFRYAHAGVPQIPSKLTATQLKGRELDAEVSENTKDNAKAPIFRKPKMGRETKGVDKGTATHAIMQFVDLNNCNTMEQLRGEADKLVRNRLITQQQADLVDYDAVLAFFRSPLGQKVCVSHDVLREFKFSLLVNADQYHPDGSGEKILLQGVVDCAIIDDDGITIVDFKTDYVTEETLPDKARDYSGQIQAYCVAMSKIFERPVKDAFLYFFQKNTFIKVV